MSEYRIVVSLNEYPVKAISLIGNDEAILRAIAAEIRQNEEAYVLIPPSVQFHFVDLHHVEPEIEDEV